MYENQSSYITKGMIRDKIRLEISNPSIFLNLAEEYDIKNNSEDVEIREILKAIDNEINIINRISARAYDKSFANSAWDDIFNISTHHLEILNNARDIASKKVDQTPYYRRIKK